LKRVGKRRDDAVRAVAILIARVACAANRIRARRRELLRLPWPARPVVLWQSAVLSAHHHGLRESLSDRLPSAVWL